MAKLVLVRHGQSIWNKENLFTGWNDVPLSKKGIREAKEAGKKLAKTKFDVAFTSELIRAHQTLFQILDLNENDNKFFKAHKDPTYNSFLRKQGKKLGYIEINSAQELNERDYGDLGGKNKEEMRKKVGAEQVHIWRRSYDVAPPQGESLKDNYKRTIPYFKKKIQKELKKGNNVLVAAHGNSLRTIVKYLDSISDKKITKLEIATGSPIVYNFDNDLNIISKRTLKK